MYYGGRPEPLSPIVAALGALTGAVAGLVVGYFGFLLATFFPHMLRTALPGMTALWFLMLWIVALTVPVLWFRSVWTGGRGIGTRVFAACGMAIVAGLFAGELAGGGQTLKRNSTTSPSCMTYSLPSERSFPAARIASIVSYVT